MFVAVGIIVRGANNTVRRNLVTLSIFPGTYQDRKEENNFQNPASIDVRKCEDLVLQDNTVAGTENIALHTDGVSRATYSEDDTYWSGNVLHTALIGILVDPSDCHIKEKRTVLPNFLIYKMMHFGIYYQSSCSVYVEGTTLVDNTIGFHAFVFGPSAIKHEYANKEATLRNSLVVGTSGGWDCDKDKIPDKDEAYAQGWRNRGWWIGKSEKPTGRTGVLWPHFGSTFTMYPVKNWHAIKFPGAIRGVLNVEGRRHQKLKFDNYCVVVFFQNL